MHPRQEASVRALYLQPCVLFGGAERQAATNAPFLARWGVDAHCVVGPGPYIVDWMVERGIANVHHSRELPGGWPPLHGLGRLDLPRRYTRAVLRAREELAELCRRERIEVIYAALPVAWIVATPVARRLGIPVIWRAGGTEITGLERAALVAWAAFNPPDLLVCCGDAVRRTYAPLIRAPSTVVRNGIDPEQFHPGAGDASLLRRPTDHLLVGFAARLAPQKRLQDFLTMAARIARVRSDVTFLVAGEGRERVAQEALARRLGLDGRVRFLGYVADMRSFYAACDVFVLPSRSEGCPNVVLEAMAMRRTLVVSNAAGTAEVLRDGREGLVYPIGDVDALTDIIERLCADDVLRATLARQAHRRVCEEFSADVCAERLALILREHARSPRRRPRKIDVDQARPVSAASSSTHAL